MKGVRPGCPGGFLHYSSLAAGVPAAWRLGCLHGLPFMRYLFDSYLHMQHMGKAVFSLKLF